ncbi:hypothetical protein PHYBOEH_007802 [Phytophthora boehmeriae]|uniref:Uncharacterized protein n=1 Tax=Phytophthora boehmeriae TaxID=109152 RepID=A0A8T1W755_9STRA|nr:hypothetical protein PHYBOEH_007802 [Phytophthora boehmeriae]
MLVVEAQSLAQVTSLKLSRLYPRTLPFPDQKFQLLRLENIDLSSIVLNAGYFFPSTTLNLTLRNCNLEKFGFDFFQVLLSSRLRTVIIFLEV